jgi:hypothetical protein
MLMMKHLTKPTVVGGVRAHIIIDCSEDKRGDLLIYLKQSVRLMENITIMPVFLMVAFIGFGFVVPAMPLISEVSAQGNMTGNQTGNWTDTGSGNISGVFNTP